MINIKDIDREELLYQLWLKQGPAPYFSMMGRQPPPYDRAAAKASADRHGYVDYACGRCIKTNIFGEDEVDPSLYDRDAGAGTFKRVVDELRGKE